MDVHLAPVGIAGEDILIGHMVCHDDYGRYVTMRKGMTRAPVGCAPRNIPQGESFSPVSRIEPPGILITSENEETDQ